MPSAEPHYEPEIIERFAARLERRATTLRNGFTASGAVLGAAFGAVPLTPLGAAWPIPELFGFATVLVGAVLGGLIGYVVGDGRGELHRLHAQTTLCQLHAQRATVAIWRLLREREDAKPAPVERIPTPASSPAPAPPPVPVATPVPAPVVAAAPSPLLAPPSPVAVPPPVVAPAPAPITPAPIVATAPPLAPAEPPVAPAPPLSEPPIAAAAPPLEEPPLAPAPPLTSPPPPLRAAPPIQAPPVSA